MPERKLTAIFGEYIKEPLLSVFKDCEVLRININAEERKIVAEVKNISVLKPEDIWECRRMIAENAGVNEVLIKLDNGTVVKVFSNNTISLVRYVPSSNKSSPVRGLITSCART